MTTTTTRPPDSLDEARDWLRERLPEGATCPCCEQFAKVYKRKINSGMTRWLLIAHHTQGGAWFHVNALGLAGGSGDFAKFRYWGLIEPGDAPGVWRVTEMGAAFAAGRARVLSHAVIYNDVLLELTGELVSVREVLGARFDYDELMRTSGTALPEVAA